MVEVPDSIERELILPAPPERVWTALTRADQLGAWFGTHATVDLRPGGAIVFRWDSSTGADYTASGVIETVEPPSRFAFHWQPSPEADTMTRVEFTLAPHPEGTRLRLVESGFASLAPELRGECRESHAEGWLRELDELADYLAAQ